MAYQALYRKWRPVNFDDMIGQEHITKTLQNQIVNNRTSHAYIFTGIRGTGKTSTAKVFSRAINCTNPQNGNPCNECPTCKGILDGSILDVSEIDAASNNGVDNIREIRDEVIYSATQTKYKIYIIDEVHMLSTGAFNALLKTLEEPPENVVFILATTDIHKVPATILSRCQRFDFRRITADDVANQLKKVTMAEGVEIEEEGIRLVARLAEGSMRDGLSIMDRCLAYGENKLSYEDIINILGVAEDSQSLEILRGISQEDTSRVVASLDTLLSAGKSIDIIINSLISCARNLLMCKCLENPAEILDITKESALVMQDMSKEFTEEKCINCIKALSDTMANIRFSPNPRVSLEICLIKLCNPSFMQSPEAYADRIAALEEKVKNGIKTVSSPVGETSSPVKKEERSKTVKIKPVGDYSERWTQVLSYIRENKSPLFSMFDGVQASGDGDVLVLLYTSDSTLGLEKIIKDRQNELFEAVEHICGKLPKRLILQRRVVEDATPDKLSKLKELGLEILK